MSITLPVFLADFFAHLKQTQLPYVVARGFAHLPQNIEGNDVDMVVHYADIALIMGYLSAYPGAQITSVAKRDNVVNVFLYFGAGEGGQIDLIHALSHKAVPYLEVESVLAARHWQGDIAIPAPEHHYLLLLLPYVFYAGAPKPSYESKLDALQKSHADKINVLLNKNAINHSNYSEKKFFLKRWFRAIFSVPRYKMQMFFLCVLQPYRRRIVCLGPDGAGKSSVLAGVQTEVEQMAKQVHLQHLKPSFFFKKRAEKRGVVTDPHRLPTRGWWLSNIKITLMACEYMLDYWLRPEKGSQIDLYDRYLHDVLIDPQRYRFAGSHRWLRVLLKLIPKADVILLLDAEPETIHARKAEVPFATTQAQCAAYKAYVSALPNGVLIDANQPLETVITQASTEVAQALAQRVKK